MQAREPAIAVAGFVPAAASVARERRAPWIGERSRAEISPVIADLPGFGECMMVWPQSVQKWL
jgi:hypothetical protein